MALKALNNKCSNTIYNLGNGKGYSVKEVIETAKKITKKEIPIKISERRQGDPSILVASSEKIKKELGWKPKYEKLETIIETAWNWHQKYPQGYLK